MSSEMNLLSFYGMNALDFSDFLRERRGTCFTAYLFLQKIYFSLKVGQVRPN